jgi:hypothetical protein
MNENELNDISTKENTNIEENNNIESQDIDLKKLFESDINGSTLTLNSNNNNEEESINNVEVNREYIPNGEGDIPPTPDFSDGSDASSNFIDDGKIRIASPDYSRLFNTYKQLFENLTEDVDTINSKIGKLADILDKSITETNAAIKVTQIYSKLFTKLVFGIDIGLVILIIVLFIIK